MDEKDLAIADSLYRGQAIGSVAKRLMANGFNVNALRTNDTLRKDEWKQMDTAVVEVVKARLVGVNDLISRGLVYNIANGLGTTVLEYEKESDMSAAEMNMDGVARAKNDRVEYTIAYLPLPIVHKDFQINSRVLEASRRLGTPLDTTQAAIAARKVAEYVETVLFTGSSTYTYGGGTIYGYLDHPNRNTGSLSAAWTSSTADPVLDAINMKKASTADGHYGPWVLYVPTNFEGALDEDYNATYPSLTVRERILKIDGIQAVRVADKLTASNVVLAEMQPESARMVIGLQPTNVEWQIEGGLVYHFKVMAIMVPQIRADVDNKSGIIHFS